MKGFQSFLFFLDTFHKRISWLDSKYKNKQTRTFNSLKIVEKGKIFGNLGKNVKDL